MNFLFALCDFLCRDVCGQPLPWADAELRTQATVTAASRIFNSITPPRIVGELGVPVAYGLRSGHVTAGNITLPFGVRAGLTIRGGVVELKILEAAVTVA